MVQHDPNGFYGLDTEHCRGKASQMQSEGEQLHGLMTGIQGMLDAVVWRGGNADRFMSNWGGTLKPRMANSSEQVVAHGRELRRRVDLQEQASER